MNLTRLADRLERIAATEDRAEAANELEQLGVELQRAAQMWRQGHNPFSSRGGMGDRVQMAVVRNGKVIQTTDTGADK